MNEHPIAYLGPEGTFAHLAASIRYPHEPLKPFRTIHDVFDYVGDHVERRGVVPIENSSGGTIIETVDEFVLEESPLVIQEEIPVRIRLALLGQGPLESCHIVYSHFVPFRYCDAWLKMKLPGVERQTVSSTAEAARLASQNPSALAIGTKQAAHIYKLNVIQYPIPGNTEEMQNVTRFICIGHKSNGGSKSSLVVSLPNEPGSLYSFLEPFGSAGVNLSRIMSRPKQGCPDECIFFIDILGTSPDKAFQAAFDRVAQKKDVTIKVVGTYPVAEILDSDLST